MARKFDVKHLIRTVMNSRTYQLSARSNSSNRDDQKYFSHAVTRLLSAEQMLDAICAVTEVPEKFQGMPAGTRAAALAHVCRTVARRAERSVVALAARAAPQRYLNRLSDLLFVLARVLNRADGGDDVYWKSERLARQAAD